MTSTPNNSAHYCYRHPDRQSYILCQRCGRTICAECQTQAAVGVHCPECIKEAKAGAPRQKSAILTSLRRSRGAPVVTYSLIGVTALIYLLQILPGSPVTNALVYFGPFTPSEPWRMITALFVHSQGSLLHILFNMFSLFIFGPLLEGMVGRARFLALYFVSGLGGSVAVLLLAPVTPVVGASGAIFGLLGAYFVIQRKLGGTNVQILIVIVLNLVIGFVPGTNIAWQAHLGGLVVGSAVALVYLRTRRRDQKSLQIGLIAGIVAVLIAVTVAAIQLYGF
ncbi:rhomboid family intramembrane serine protease [Salinibacterium sp. G-O1]|uniref:rhomboid family intramembrane serine protease n=1 Tax=Salinibacterium sp. G-O1 TaxID=3046208 RepID=UPI0024BA44AF|nr:rhomboid family intramembrane serine protease [Salinibacterium sp. G-O1]MDJ0333673.1 rhomboid family intramembrane serine protease [Salinibacterium sp. G-O1]